MRKRSLGIFFVLFMLASMTGCVENENIVKETKSKKEIIEHEEPSAKLVEDRSIYEFDKDRQIIHLYVTVFGGKDGLNTSFSKLNHWYEFNSQKSNSPKLNILVQEGNEKEQTKGGFQIVSSKANASIEIRGASNRLAPQKSYKINMYDSGGLWRGQKTINLNKHAYDFTRVRNKLSFDYFTLLPDMTSLRTQFVHLHVKDLTAKKTAPTFTDFGLYTHVEQVNERFLASHGLDPNGNLYKATNFEFFRYPEQLKLVSDPSYRKEDFETILEIKGSEDHAKLLKMLDDVNNPEKNINDIVENYFDQDNYLSWVATNILLGNLDTNSQNFYLYSPVNSKKWYFLPWDYDAAWGWYEEQVGNRRSLGSWQSGIGNYWGVVLHKRFFKDPKNVKKLNEKIEQFSKLINKNQTKEFLDYYYPIVKPIVSKSPDLNYLPVKINQYDKIFKHLVEIPQKNKANYYKTQENPMPVYLSQTKIAFGNYLFEWDYSYDLQGDEIKYDFLLSRDPTFSKIIKQEKNLINTKITVNRLTPGRYFWKVKIRDSKNNSQEAYDYYENEDGEKFHGLRELIVR